jgi:transmembrane sensor
MKIEAADAQMDAEVYPGDSVNRITMLSGSARIVFGLKGRLQQDTFHLVGNQELISSSEKINIKEASDTSETISWKNGRIHFTNAGIQTIMRSIVHGYGVQVEYKGRITDQKFSMDLPRQTKLWMVLSSLESQGLHYSIKENTIIIQ